MEIILFSYCDFGLPSRALPNSSSDVAMADGRDDKLRRVAYSMDTFWIQRVGGLLASHVCIVSLIEFNPNPSTDRGQYLHVEQC